MQVRVLTLNVWTDHGNPRRPKIVNKELQSLNPDLISLPQLIETPGQRQLDTLSGSLSLHSTHQIAVLDKVRERRAVALSGLHSRHRTAVPTIIGGDFNGLSESACICYISGLQSTEGHRAKYHDAWEVAGEEPGCWLSDHFGVVGDLEIGKKRRIARQQGLRSTIEGATFGEN